MKRPQPCAAAGTIIMAAVAAEELAVICRKENILGVVANKFCDMSRFF